MDFTFKHAVYAVVSEETVRSVGIFGKREVDMETEGKRVLSSCSEDVAGTSEDGHAEGTQRSSEM